MENQEKIMRPIPKNVRQIGELDGEVRLYVEDYVNTFIRKCARTGRLVLGALVGDWYVQEDKEYLFVEGAIQADGYYVSDGRIQMTDETWSGIYGKLDEFFGGKSICGWFLCCGETESCDVGMLRGFMYENIGREKRALIVCDMELEQEAFFVYDRDFIREQSGYYLFYERNEPMQSYMVTTSVAVRTDPVAVDAAASMVRMRTVERKEIPTQQAGYSMMSAAAMVIGVIALAFGIVTLNHYEQLREMESVLTNLTGALLGNQETDGETDEEKEGDSTEADQTVGGLIIEDVEGGVEPSEDETEATEADEVGATNASGEENSGADSSEGAGSEVSGNVNSGGETSGAGENSTGGNMAGEDQTGENTADSPDSTMEAATEANAKEYRTYVVQAGETLVSICWTVYGYRDDNIIRQICEINHISDKDHIYAGQELLIP